MKEIRLCDTYELDFTVDLCKKYGLGIEVQSFYDPYLENRQAVIEKHKTKLSDIRGGKSLHAPFWDLNIGSKIKFLREGTLDIFNDAYQIAKELGCTEIVVHNGYIPGTYYEGAWIKRAEQFWNQFFCDKDDSITMCIENQFELYSDMMKAEIDAVGDSRLKVCLDIGHVHANANMKIEDWIKTLGERIGYVHLHNNHGKQSIIGHNNDEHLGLQDGTMDMKRVLELLEEYAPNAIWNIESNTKSLEESVRYLGELGYLSIV